MVNNEKTGGTGTQQLGSPDPDQGLTGAGAAIGGVVAVQNPSAGGTDGDAEEEARKLREEKEELAEQIGKLSKDLAEALDQVEKAKKDTADNIAAVKLSLDNAKAAFVKEKDGLLNSIKTLKDEVASRHRRLCDALSAGNGAHRTDLVYDLKVKLEKVCLEKDGLERLVAELEAKAEKLRTELAVMKKVAEGLEVERANAVAELALLKVAPRKGFFAFFRKPRFDDEGGQS